MIKRNRVAYKGRRRLVIGCAAVIVAALALAACGEDEGEDAAASTPDGLELVIEGRDQTVTLVDNPGQRVAPPGSKLDSSKETPGDQAIQESVLRDTSGEEVGRNHTVFTTVAEGGIELAAGTLSLEGGQVMGQGIIGAGGEDVLAIVGGTGDYAGARGTLTVRQDGDRVTLLLDFAD
ncbi:hypothetical protein BH20ACT15_BH20ACT15_10770 [soil metagenome]